MLDTGILLRLVNRLAPEHGSVVQAVSELRRRGGELLTTAQNIVEFWNVSTRPKTARVGFGRTTQEVARCVEFFERMGRILPDDDRILPTWRKIVIDQRVQGKAVHDARIVAHMMIAGVDHLLTLNPSDFQRYSTITVRTPSEMW